MRYGIVCLFVALALQIVTAADPATSLAATTKAGADLAQQIGEATGSESWRDVRRLRFTWTFAPKNVSRSYDWDVPAGHVSVSEDGAQVQVRVDGTDLTRDTTKAHESFVNDHYWLLFGLRVLWDSDVSLSREARSSVPGFPELQVTEALVVQYQGDGGYTPGDRYVLYLGEDSRLPRAWSYHRAGAGEPTLVTTWQDYVKVGGLTVPTRFVAADGTTFITVSDIAVN